MEKEKYIKHLLALMEDGDLDIAVKEAKDVVVKQGIDEINYLQNCLTPVMDELGNRFSRMEIFLPELLVAAEIADGIRKELTKSLELQVSSNKGKIVIGTVSGDNHDIGKNIVSTLLSVNGYEIVDLGTDVDPMSFINTVKSEKADVLAMSSLLSTSMPFMVETIELLDALGLHEKVKVVVGGGPVSNAWALEVGADGYGHDAKEAVMICDQLIAK